MGNQLNIPEPQTGLRFCDVHCHIPWTIGAFTGDADESLVPSPAQQVDDFKAAGGLFLITCSIDLKSAKRCFEFALANESVYFSPGIAPQTVTYTKKKAYAAEYEQWLDFIETNGYSDKIVAFGEIGLDFHHAKALGQRERQISELGKILAFIADKGKPLVLHVRNPGEADKDTDNPSHPYNKPDAATRQVVTLIDKYGVPPSQVLFHCYSGPAALNAELVDRGFWFSVPSSSYSFEKWYKISASLPAERLMTETDSPFQDPISMEPINTPANARYALATIARARNLDQEVISEMTVENARKFFKIVL